MNSLKLAALGASVALAAAPAYAQTTNHSTNSVTSSQSQMGQQGNTNPRQELRQSLEKAGFTHVRVEPEVFVVHALNSQGQPVLMRIGPDSMEAVTAMNPNHQNSSSNTNGSGQQHASSSAHNGTTSE